ncbi:hypothetical protein [Aquipuribacter hungaricus]|uniref:Uncharacterized protein n=1 Tax=Aquipuribacter hungaricus TaxID=545624 RepID=A0ABV7WD62_9MICO
MDRAEPPRTRAAARRAELRQAVLALAVLDDVDLVPGDDGVDLAAGGRLTWPDVAAAVGAWAALPEHPVTRHRLLVATKVVGVVAVGGADELLGTCHAHGEPADTATLGCGPAWVRERAGDLVLGLGVSDLAGMPGPSPLPPLPSLDDVLAARLAARWVEVREDLERLGGLVVARLERDAQEQRPLVLRPTGTADVVTLLGSRRLRTALADGDGTGMRGVAVPVRERGWFDLARIDPAFVGAAWAASEPMDRAFGSPLLVTTDAVTVPAVLGDVLAGVLADPAGPSLDRDLRRRG